MGRAPLRSLRVRAELFPEPTGGTRLVYESWLVPRGILGLLGTPPAMSFVNRRSFGAAFRKYDEMIQRGGATIVEQSGVAYAPGGQARLDAARRELRERIHDAELASHVADAVAQGDDFSLARLRAYALADATGSPRLATLEACLQATRLGIFDLQWDVLCPLCRGAKRRHRPWPTFVEKCTATRATSISTPASSAPWSSHSAPVPRCVTSRAVSSASVVRR